MISFKTHSARLRYVAEHAWEATRQTLLRMKSWGDLDIHPWGKLDAMFQVEILDDVGAVLRGSHLVSHSHDYDLALTATVLALAEVTRVEE
jgi:hypothetical protein